MENDNYEKMGTSELRKLIRERKPTTTKQETRS